MKTLMTSVLIVSGMTIAAICNAQAPAGSTGACKDGSYTSTASKRGACKDHGGVKDWYGSTPPAKEPAGAKTTAAAAAAPATTAAPTPAAAAPAAAGGPGQVWVNPKSKVYHCSGTKWYGKTKDGSYMTESAAKAAGNHPDHGRACS
jgi:hypothetical protein